MESKWMVVECTLMYLWRCDTDLSTIDEIVTFFYMKKEAVYSGLEHFTLGRIYKAKTNLYPGYKIT